MRSYSKKMRPGGEVILLTPRYYVFSLRGETGDSETDIIDGFIFWNPPALKTCMVASGDEEKILKNCQTSQLRSFFLKFQVDSAPVVRKKIGRTP
jgi:hypothetical protein